MVYLILLYLGNFVSSIAFNTLPSLSNHPLLRHPQPQITSVLNHAVELLERGDEALVVGRALQVLAYEGAVFLLHQGVAALHGVAVKVNKVLVTYQ